MLSKMNSFLDYKPNVVVMDETKAGKVKVQKEVIFNSNISILNKINTFNIINQASIQEKKKQTLKQIGKTPLLATAVVGVTNTAAPLPKPHPYFHSWTDLDAQEYHLSLKPTCYLILNKPGVGAYSLGEAIAKKLNCIHLCPRNIILDEIEQKSQTGIALDFNLRHNKSCKFDVLIDILKQKLKSEVIKHKGYVISGFPLVIGKRDPVYYFGSLNGEEPITLAEELIMEVLENVGKKKKRKKFTADASSASYTAVEHAEEEEIFEEEEEPEKDDELEEEEEVVELPKHMLESCSNIITQKKTYLKTTKVFLIEQLTHLFKLEMKPDVIIYLTCPDSDMITKKSNKYINCKTGIRVLEPFNLHSDNSVRWPPKNTFTSYSKPYDSRSHYSSFNCKQPIDFTEKSTEQMCNYSDYLVEFMEEKIKDFDPNYVIKLDGRNSTHEMIYNFMERLFYVPSIRPVIVPEPLYLEDPTEDMEEFWTMIGESNIISSNNVSFRRTPSPWDNWCPVELQKRRSTKGKAKYSVNFFKHVYLMSSLDAMIKFCINPRPYLKLQYLEPTCRFIIMGTKYSGKSMIANCFSWLFNTKIFSFNTFYDKENDKKVEFYSRNILSEIIPTIEDARIMKWRTAEDERRVSLSNWVEAQKAIVKKYLPALIDHLAYNDHVLEIRELNEKRLEEERINFSERKAEEKRRLHELGLQQSSVSAVSGEIDELADEDISLGSDAYIPIPEEDPKTLSNFNNLRELLTFLPCQVIDDKTECENLLKNDALAAYAANKLSKPLPEPATPLYGDEDVSKAIHAYITENDLQKEFEPTTGELMEEFTKTISDLDIESLIESSTYAKYIIDGFPSDPEYWDYLVESKVLPDHTVVIMESREIEPELIQQYEIVLKSTKNHKERFLQADDILIKNKLLAEEPAKEPTKSHVLLIVQDLINKVLMNNIEIQSEEEMLKFSQDIFKFKEDWDNVKVKLEENLKSYNEVEIDEKSDIGIVEEILLKLRKSYNTPCLVSEDEEADIEEDDQQSLKNLESYNDSIFFGSTNRYCPVAFYDHNVLWEGKPMYSIKHRNISYYLSKEGFVEKVQSDITKYQSFNKPFKQIPALRICVIGCLGSGKTSVSKFIATELGLMHIDFAEILNELLLPRHFKKVGHKYENSFTDPNIDEELVQEFQMDEENPNSSSDIMANELEARRMVHNYLERGLPMLPTLMQNLLRKLWFEDPFSDIGFVLDGFPRLTSDIEEMVTGFFIPDIIIELESNADVAVTREMPEMINTWKEQLVKAKQMSQLKLAKEKDNWFNSISGVVVCRALMEELIFSIPTLAKAPLVGLGSQESVLIPPEDATDVENDEGTQEDFLKAIYDEIVAENPEPVDTAEWESLDEAKDRIETRLQNIFDVDEENILTVKDLAFEQKIKVFSVNATKSLPKVCRHALLGLSQLRSRNESFFEQTFVIKNEIAEILLTQGYYFLSQFNRLCPVYINDNPKSILNPYKVSKRDNKIFSVVHRCYIYFICGKENLAKFRNNPLRYIVDDTNLKKFIQYPLRIGIIGPPKSGKSTLAAKLSKKYGLLCFSKGMALRNVHDYMSWTCGATKMKSFLIEGHVIDKNTIINAIHTVTVDERTCTVGYVFDGFPEFASEALLLQEIGLYPQIILDITCTKDTAISNSQKEIYNDILKIMPPYSITLIEDRYNYWLQNKHNVRNWIDEDLQNRYVIDGNISKWQCSHDAEAVINKVIAKTFYFLNYSQKRSVPMDAMCVSTDLFRERMSYFKHFCPVCFRKNRFKQSGFPIDKKGVVYYEKSYFWVCEEHLDIALIVPYTYLTHDFVSIPEIPAAVKHVNMSLVYENGVCIVTYADNLPNHVIVPGVKEFAASYSGKTYLFCSESCLNKFMLKPFLYFDVSIFKDANAFPPLDVNRLPVLGYLEQTVGDLLTGACCAVNALRPKYPGLDSIISGLLFIALYLKVNNPNSDPARLAPYKNAFKIYEARSKLVLYVGLRMRSMDNPFAEYPQCCPVRESLLCMHKTGSVISACSYIAGSSMSASRVPVPDERFDYLCEYHKPASKVPAFLNVVDIAGLVRGAAEGQGLGNAFLSHIKACDAIFNLCRAFDDEDVIHVDGDVNPIRDLETIGEELRLKDEEQLMQNFEKLDRVVSRGGDKKLKPEYDALTRIKAVLVDEKKHIRFGDWSAADIEVLNKYLFLTSKPALYLVNLSEKDYIRKKNKWLPKLKEWIDKNDPGAPLIPFSGVLESKLFEMTPEEKQAFLKEHNITSAMDKIIVMGYKALQLEYFFTAGPDEVKAWTIQRGTKAPQAAGRIHTDFEKGFIMAEVMHFKDFKEEGTEAACKAAGKYRQQGRNYVVEDGDIIFFKFNAGAGLKDAKKK